LDVEGLSAALDEQGREQPWFEVKKVPPPRPIMPTASGILPKVCIVRW
jgi:hypothetical protein